MAAVIAAPLISTGAKVAAVLIVAIGLFGSGAYLGYHYASNAAKASVVTKVVTQTKVLPAEEKTITAVETKIKVIHDKIYVEVPKLVADNRACDVPAAGVGLLNSNRALPAAP